MLEQCNQQLQALGLKQVNMFTDHKDIYTL
jgi:uncharacterized SAM-dependent methyltransferase